jgi:hypothetical protein
MKWLLATLLMFAVTAQADTAWFYDPERSGEGIIVTEFNDGTDRLAFAFYSHTATINGEPTISPSPPAPLFCDLYTVWFTGLSNNYTDNQATGDVYYTVADDDFDGPSDGSVGTSYVVGTFDMRRSKGGFVFKMYSNYTMCNLSVFNTVFHMTEKLAE